MGGTAFAYTVDLSSKDKIYEMARVVRDQIGPVSMLVNNAGIVSGSTLLETPDSKNIPR